MNASFAGSLPSGLSGRLSGGRASRLYSELGFALARLERDALRGWGTRSASH
jgi:hypothetical protein